MQVSPVTITMWYQQIILTRCFKKFNNYAYVNSSYESDCSNPDLLSFQFGATEIRSLSCWSQTPERGVSRLGEAYKRWLWRSPQETAQESAKAS